MRIDRLDLRLRLRTGERLAFGPGRADLLDAIGREGSIAAAARALGMSYRRAWLLVDDSNRVFRERLVETLPGGARDRGARLTPAGHAVLAAYRALERDAAGLTDSDAYRRLAAALRDDPGASTAPD